MVNQNPEQTARDQIDMMNIMDINMMEIVTTNVETRCIASLPPHPVREKQIGHHNLPRTLNKKQMDNGKPK